MTEEIAESNLSLADDVSQPERKSSQEDAIWKIVSQECRRRRLGVILQEQIYQRMKYIKETDLSKIRTQVNDCITLELLAKEKEKEDYAAIMVDLETRTLHQESETIRSQNAKAAAKFETVPPKITVEYRLDLARARKVVYATQAAFAQALNEKTIVIQDLESGKAPQPSANLERKLRTHFKQKKVPWEH